MLHFDKLSLLHTHQTYLSGILPEQDMFFVGGCIRDILLGSTEDPKDIDLTCTGHPNKIRENMKYDEHYISRFRTEKFGTMTFMPKTKNSIPTDSLPLGGDAEGRGGYKHDEKINYELTPLRTEGSYTDVRHPDDITWSNSIIADSQRRDFTINSLYRYGTPLDTITTKISSPTTKITSENFSHLLKKHQVIYIVNIHTLILQDHTIITTLFKDGVFQSSDINTIFESAYLCEIDSFQQSTISNQQSTISILIDPHGGCRDLLERKIRTVGNPNDRLTEDALRILRGVRFPNILNQYLPDKDIQNSSFDIEKATRTAMQTHAHLVSTLAKERIHEELVKVFKQDNPFGYITLLDELGLIEILFPALAACKGNIQPTLYHPFDTYVHTLLTLHALQELQKENRKDSQSSQSKHNIGTDAPPVKGVDTPVGKEGVSGGFLTKIAMLYHDVGKPDQYAYVSEQKAKNPENIDMSEYVHHTETGVGIARTDLLKLGFSKKEIEEICRYIRRHHRPGEILNGKERGVKKKLRKLLSDGGKERTLNLMDIAIADRRGQFNPLQGAATTQLEELKSLVLQIFEEEGRFTMKDLAVNGTLLMETYDIPAGPELGKILKKCFDRVLADLPNRNNEKSILTHVKSLL